MIVRLSLVLNHSLLDGDTCVSQFTLVGIGPVVRTEWVLKELELVSKTSSEADVKLGDALVLGIFLLV